MPKDLEQYWDRSARQISGFIDQVSGDAQMGSMVSGVYKEMMDQWKSTMEHILPDDETYQKLLMELNQYKNDLAENFFNMNHQIEGIARLQQKVESMFFNENEKWISLLDNVFLESYKKFYPGNIPFLNNWMSSQKGQPITLKKEKA
jgi:hypothetical protein